MAKLSGSRADRLYARAWAIKDRKANGFWLPILQHLALHGHQDAMVTLADWYAGDSSLGSCGTFMDGYSAAGLYRRAWKLGDGYAARNLAIDHFNRNDLIGYRHWLRKAANSGDPDSALELRHFETRLWHGDARRIRRLRPRRRAEL
jgi:TPR repeat protein